MIVEKSKKPRSKSLVDIDKSCHLIREIMFEKTNAIDKQSDRNHIEHSEKLELLSSQLNNTIAELETERNEKLKFKESCSLKESTIEMLNSKIQKIQEIKVNLTLLIDEKLDLIKELENKIKNFEKTKTNFKKERQNKNQMKTKLEEKEREIECLKLSQESTNKRILQIETENRNLSDALLFFEKESSVHKSIISNLQNKEKYNNLKINEQQKSLNDSSVVIKKLQFRLKQQESEIKNKEQAQEDYKSEVEKRIDDLESKSNIANQEISQKNKNHKQRIKELKKENDKKELDLTLCLTQIDKLQSQKEENDSLIKALIEENQILMRENQRIRTKSELKFEEKKKRDAQESFYVDGNNNISSNKKNQHAAFEKMQREAKREKEKNLELMARLSELERNKKRTELDGDYLKNVLVKFLTVLPVNEKNAKQMIPVVASVLHFTDGEVDQIEKAWEDFMAYGYNVPKFMRK